MSSGFTLRPWVALVVLLVGTGCGSTRPPASPPDSSPSEATFPRLPERPSELRAFLYDFPKGGDVHTHLTGAVYAETYLEIARERGLCYQPEPFVLTECPARGDSAEALSPYGELASSEVTPRHSVDRLFESQTRYDRALNALSLRGWTGQKRSGHDQFFGSFDRFDAVQPADPFAAARQRGRFMAELVQRAGAQNLSYVEVQTMLRGKETAERTAGLSLPKGQNRFSVLVDSLDARGFDALADSVADEFDVLDREASRRLGCTRAASPSASCQVVRRYQYHAIRVLPPVAVFGQLLTGFRAAARNGRVVAVNLVAPEDHRIAVRDYALHMQMVKYLRGRFPEVNVTLHAGELTLGLVPPEALRDHVDQAVNVAGATRIGHAIDFFHETRDEALLEQFRDEEILIEVCLTSNDVILGVEGRDHPLPTWMEAGIPIALATDDEGVSRMDLTHEFQRAAQTYDLTTADLVQFARNSLHYSFLAGDALWKSGSYDAFVDACADATPSRSAPTSCQSYLNANPKAAVQWDFEQRLRAWAE